MRRAADVHNALEEQGFRTTRARILTSCVFVMFFDGYDFSLLGYLAPALLRHFSVDNVALGSAIAAGVLGYMVGGGVFGILGDRFGRKKLILAGVTLFSALTIACAFADSILSFSVLRFLAGVGLGGAIPNTVALTTEYTPKRIRAAMVGVLFVGYALGGAAPGWIAAWLMPRFDWRIVVLVGGVIPLAGVAVIAFTLVESVRFLATRPHYRDELVLTINKLAPEGAIPIGIPIRTRQQATDGFLLRLLFVSGRAPQTLLLWIAFVCTIGAIFFVVSWTATLMVSQGIPPDRAALVGAMFLTGGAVGCLVIPAMIDRVGFYAVIASLGIAAPCVAAIGRAGTKSHSMLTAVVFVAGLLTTGGQAGLNAVASTIYPAVIRATGVGWALGVSRIGAIVAPVIGGALISRGVAPAALFLYAAISVAMAASSIALLKVFGYDNQRPD